MGKSPPTSPAKAKLQVQQLTGIASQLIKTPKPAKPLSPKCLISSKLKRKMEDSESESENLGEKQFRIPLSQVVSVCVKGWFQDTLREAKAGDFNMQVLVGQMYNSGYGVRRDAQKGRFWMTRASRVRSSVWKVSHKRPGYNASDSDSDEVKDGS